MDFIGLCPEIRVDSSLPVNVPVLVTKKAFIGTVRWLMMGNLFEPRNTAAAPAARPIEPPRRPPFTVALDLL